ncbi:MAG: YlxM family DNA-binding protein [Syntrophomonadaceae bacterium]|jgi:predicted DNA-binding protein YlxM (UPF0122 family)
MLQKRSQIILLKDFYGPLLTEKQQNVLNLHYENDWSLGEISNNMKITRQAVYDILKRAEIALQNYEKRLGLVARFMETRHRLQEVYTLIDKLESQGDKNKALQVLREISDLL